MLIGRSSRLEMPTMMMQGGVRLLSSVTQKSAYAKVRPQGSNWKYDPSWGNELSGKDRESALQELTNFVGSSSKLVVITGAGCSTASGVPDYRGAKGSYRTGHKPMTHQEFLNKIEKRKRYWARSFVGWKDMSKALPNRAHDALALLETHGIVSQIITQNVDGLHQKAGSKNVLNLHGSINHVRCLICNHLYHRKDIQIELSKKNLNFQYLLNEQNNLNSDEFFENKEQRPDGDANLSDRIDFDAFQVPHCGRCSNQQIVPSTLSSLPSSSSEEEEELKRTGFLKPDVVFFGDSVPKTIVASATQAVEEGDGLLVVGSSLEVHSAYKFLLKTHQLNKPICIVNLGETRPERKNITPLKKIHLPCDEALWEAVTRLGLVPK